MAKIRNISGERRLAPALGGRLVLAGQILDCPDELVYAHTASDSIWSPFDAAAQAAHDAGVKAEAAAVAAEAGPAVRVDESVELLTELPAHSALKGEWEAAALTLGVAPDVVEASTKDQLIQLAEGVFNGDNVDEGGEG